MAARLDMTTKTPILSKCPRFDTRQRKTSDIRPAARIWKRSMEIEPSDACCLVGFGLRRSGIGPRLAEGLLGGIDSETWSLQARYRNSRVPKECRRCKE